MTTVYRWTGHEAKLLRQALRLSVRDFAARLGIGVRTVNKWEARRADITPLPHMQEVLDTALARASDETKTRFAAATRADVPEHETMQLSGQPVRGAMLPVVVNGRLIFMPVEAGVLPVAPLAGHADIQPLERLASAARQPSRVDAIAVEHLELMTQTHRSLYQDFSSVELVPALTGHLQLTTLLLGGTQRLPLRRRLAAIAGETAGHAAWLLHDLGDQHRAAQYYSAADVATRDAGDPALDAYVRGFRSLVMGSQGRARDALGLARGAVEIAQRSAAATTRSWLTSLEARALASLGDTKSCLGALRRADTAMEQARREEDPAWMYEFDHAGEALEIAVETGSTAGIQRVRRFRPDLTRWNGTRAVTALDEQLADAI